MNVPFGMPEYFSLWKLHFKLVVSSVRSQFGMFIRYLKPPECESVVKSPRPLPRFWVVVFGSCFDDRWFTEHAALQCPERAHCRSFSDWWQRFEIWRRQWAS